MVNKYKTISLENLFSKFDFLLLYTMRTNRLANGFVLLMKERVQHIQIMYIVFSATQKL